MRGVVWWGVAWCGVVGVGVLQPILNVAQVLLFVERAWINGEWVEMVGGIRAGWGGVGWGGGASTGTWRCSGALGREGESLSWCLRFSGVGWGGPGRGRAGQVGVGWGG